MKKLLLFITATIFVAVTMNAQDAGLFTGKKDIVLAPDVNATIIQNVHSGTKDAIYNPPDSPAPYAYNSNTYTELGWTEIIVSETDVIGVVTVDYTWDTDTWYYEGSFRLQSPAGTSVVFASWDLRGTYSVSMADFFGETMNGTWILWIEDTYGDGGHQATGITLTFRTVLDHDLGVTGILPAYVPSGESAVPQIDVYNFALNDETVYEVNLSDGDAYNETVNITTPLVSNSLAVIDFPEWSPADGVYSLTATVSLSGDEYPANDVYVDTCYIGPGEYPTETVYTYDVDGDNTNFVLEISLASGAVNPLINPGTGDYFVCAEYMNGAVYAIQAHTNIVYIVLADGNAVQVGTLSGITPGMIVMGFAYDHINDVMYASASYGQGPDSHFYTVDASWNCTYVGNISNCVFFGLATDATGDLYGFDALSDHFYSIDKASGTSTDIGAIGYNINATGDIGGDKVADVIYGTLYDWDNEVGLFGTFNVSTGAFTVINSDLGGRISMCAVIHDPIITIEELTNEGISIYPNPSSGVFNVESFNSGNYMIEISDINGKMIYSKINLDENIQIDLSKYSKGIYIIRIKSVNEIRTAKIVLK